MITVRNKDLAFPISAVHGGGGAVFKPGMLVKLAQGAAAGSLPKAVPFATAAEVADVTVPKGIITYIPRDSQTTDFAYDVVAQKLGAPVDDTIPATNEVGQPTLVTVWQGAPVFGVYKNKFDAALVFATLREPTKMGFKFQSATTGALLAAYASGNTDGSQTYVGYVLRVDGPEATIAFKGL